MQNQVIKYELLDNSTDNYVVVNLTKQQMFSVPREESQVIQGQTYNFTGVIPFGYTSDPATQTENRNSYMNTIVDGNYSIIITANYGISSVLQLFGTSDSFGNVHIAGSSVYLTNVLGVKLTGTLISNALNLSGIDSNNDAVSINGTVNKGAIDGTMHLGSGSFAISGVATQISGRDDQSPFLPTNYIGMATYEVPIVINELYTDVFLLNGSTLAVFYSSFGNVVNVGSGLQLLKIPMNVFSTTLTDPVAIAANGGPIVWNYNKYNLLVAPKYVQSQIVQIDRRQHFPYDNLEDDKTPLSNTPLHLRRNIYYCDNSDFQSTVWGFESTPNQSGRLLGSIAEIWNSTGSTLKQVKIVNENSFDFSGTLFAFVLSPDNVGYDPISQDIVVGDIVRIYPRETYFNQAIIEIDFVDRTKTVKAALQFMLNDVARDLRSATYEVYDDNGLTIDPVSGIIDGTVAQRYQIAQYGNFEIRKKQKP